MSKVRGGFSRRAGTACSSSAKWPSWPSPRKRCDGSGRRRPPADQETSGRGRTLVVREEDADLPFVVLAGVVRRIDPIRRVLRQEHAQGPVLVDAPKVADHAAVE